LYVFFWKFVFINHRILRRQLVRISNLVLVEASILLIYRFIVLSFKGLFSCNFFILLSLNPFVILVMEVVEIILISKRFWNLIWQKWRCAIDKSEGD